MWGVEVTPGKPFFLHFPTPLSAAEGDPGSVGGVGVTPGNPPFSFCTFQHLCVQIFASLSGFICTWKMHPPIRAIVGRERLTIQLLMMLLSLHLGLLHAQGKMVAGLIWAGRSSHHHPSIHPSRGKSEEILPTHSHAMIPNSPCNAIYLELLVDQCNHCND